nr:MAG TPA: holin [Caudoviricetes sp.]
MTDKVYNVLKYCALVALPAFGTFYTTVATLWGWSYVAEVSGTILAFDTLLGAFVGISSARYQPAVDGVLHVNPNTQETYAALTTPTDTVVQNGTMLLKVQESPDM